MRESGKVSGPAKLNFYVNAINLIPFLIVIITGLVLQIRYHMHRLPDAYVVSGLNRSGWLLLHRISAVIVLALIVIHCILHRKAIAAARRRIFGKASGSSIKSSYYLFLLFVLTSLTAMISWIFWDHGEVMRHTLVEIHDKLSLLLILFSAVHIVPRLDWMVKTYRKLRNTGIG